jgi:Fic family protein
MTSFPEKIVKDFQDRLDVSWIFHDHALEGVVLSYSELKAAVDSRIISDVTLIPMYEEVRCHKQAVDFIRETSQQKKKPPVDLELVKKLYGLITTEAAQKGAPYRKENPLHRLYYHEIATPEKIQPRMKKLQEWLESSEFENLHPVVAGARLQHQLLSIYPWTKNTGKVARLLTNYMLICAGYPPAVIHSIERQRYYEALRHESDALVQVVFEALQNSIDTALKFYGELSGLRVKRAS